MNPGGNAPAFIGSDRGRSEFFQGEIDDLRIYEGGLRREQIAALALGKPEGIKEALVAHWKFDGEVRNEAVVVPEVSRNRIALLGAAWLILKTEGEIQAKMFRLFPAPFFATLGALGVLSVWMVAAHPEVVEAAVVGVPDERWDERPLACVVLSEGSQVGLSELSDFLVGRVAKWWLPERWSFIDEVPKTSVGKFDKKVLRARHEKGELRVEGLDQPVDGAGDQPGAESLLALRNINSDQINNRLVAVEKAEAEKFARENNYEHVGTSAKSGENVNETFELIARKIIDRQ